MRWSGSGCPAQAHPRKIPFPGPLKGLLTSAARWDRKTREASSAALLRPPRGHPRAIARLYLPYSPAFRHPLTPPKREADPPNEGMRRPGRKMRGRTWQELSNVYTPGFRPALLLAAPPKRPARQRFFQPLSWAALRSLMTARGPRQGFAAEGDEAEGEVG